MGAVISRVYCGKNHIFAIFNNIKTITMKRLIMMAVAALMTAAPAVTAQDQPAAQVCETSPQRSLVFDKNTYGSKYYRIPALATAKDGSLVAVADKRIDKQSDLPGRIDVVSRRSTDGGKTWSEPVTVAANDEIGGYGDPAIVLDRRTGDLIVISSHGNGLWGKTPAHISISRSRDNGVTWEPAVDINNQIKASIPGGGENYEAWFASSGRALQLADGRLMFALVTRRPGVEGFPVYAVYSDDGGHTWRVSENAATLNGDEAKVVQLADGSLIMSIRNRFKGPRNFSYSTDRGKTWSAPVEIADLPDPACNGDIIRYTDGGRNLLLQTMPGSPTEREDVTVWVSGDNGRTWPHRHRIVRAPSAYSAMSVLPDGRVGFLTEETSDNGDGFRIWLTVLPIDKILK